MFVIRLIIIAFLDCLRYLGGPPAPQTPTAKPGWAGGPPRPPLQSGGAKAPHTPGRFMDSMKKHPKSFRLP